MILTKRERMELIGRARSRTGRAEDARRARVILLLIEGATWDAVCHAVGCSRGFVANWSRRFADERLGGLYSRYRGQVPLRHTLRQKPASWRPRGGCRPTGRPTGARANSPLNSGSAICGWHACGRSMESSPTAWNAIWPPTIQTSRRRRRENRARRHRPGHLHLHQGSRQEAHAVYPSLQ
jgi:hypothetical protein